MDFGVAERVHIMPVGYEVSRVVEAAKGYKADKVILVTHNENDFKADECLAKIERKFEQLEYEVEIEYCDLFDLYDSLAKISSIINKHSDDEVYFNVSTGSKITAVAGTIASMVQGATAYYLKAKTYEGVPEGVDHAEELPHYPLDVPKRDQTAILKYIELQNSEGKFPTKGKLIFFSEQNNLRFTQDNIQGKGKYRLLDMNALNPLQEDGRIEIQKEGRKKIVEITDEGRAALRAFENLYDFSEIDWNPDQQTEQEA